MHRVAFVVYPGFELLDMSGPVAVFDGTNHVLAQSGKAPFYIVDVISTEGGLIRSSSGVTVQSSARNALDSRPDTLLVMGAQQEELMLEIAERGLRAWLPKIANKVPRFGSVCSGAFVLASLGLLDGRCVATHWNACAPLAKAYPRVKVDSDSLYVVDGNLWTSAGVSTGIDMALAMVTRDLDSAMASEVARGLVLYARRAGYQSQFSPLLQAQTKADNPFAELIAWLMSNLHAPLDVSALAARAGLSERTFHRRFVAATGETPARFVESARLDAARMLLSRGATPKSVAARVGLAPAARFTEAFERRFGVTPRLFRDTHAES
jgi:transcriptional regulator GlxA family with amidase domain